MKIEVTQTRKRGTVRIKKRNAVDIVAAKQVVLIKHFVPVLLFVDLP